MAAPKYIVDVANQEAGREDQHLRDKDKEAFEAAQHRQNTTPGNHIPGAVELTEDSSSPSESSPTGSEPGE